jgi:hypothetical protein
MEAKIKLTASSKLRHKFRLSLTEGLETMVRETVKRSRRNLLINPTTT